MGIQDGIKAKLSVVIIASLSIGVLVLLAISTYKMYRVFRQNNTFLLMMMITLNFALIGRIVFLISYIIIFSIEGRNQDKNILYALKVFIPLYFLTASVIFHLSSWIMYIIDIDTLLRRNRCSKGIAKLLLITIQIMNFIVYLSFIIYGCTLNSDQPEFKSYIYAFMMTSSSQLFVIGIGFVIIGLVLLKTVKEYSFTKWLKIK